jgi:hypothetical protein
LRAEHRSIIEDVMRGLRSLAMCVVAGGLATGGTGCAHQPAVGRGGRVYAVRVVTVDGHPTATRGSIAYPACTLQFGDQVAQVWLAHPSRDNAVSPVLLQADEVTLKEGILVERSWSEATVHDVTDAELASGTAVVYIPSIFHLTVVELSFEPVGEKRRSRNEDDLAKGGAGLDEPVPRRNVSKR